jgi:predicted ester cyclase
MDQKAANHALGRMFFAEQDRLKGDLPADLCAPEYQARVGSGPMMDRAGHSGFGRAFYAAFPDLHHEIEQVIAENDVAVVRFVLQGTHTAALFGIPATNRRITVPAHVILRIQDGKVTSLLGVFDEAGMLRQLGVLASG